jgi:hypothetical protein
MVRVVGGRDTRGESHINTCETSPNFQGNRLRDINAAAQHLMVSDAAYENYGQFLLGLPDADPMR